VSSPQPAWQSKEENVGNSTGRGASAKSRPSKHRPPGRSFSLGFYRKHTESLLRRYLYASMQVGRAPNILGDPIARDGVPAAPYHLRGRGDLRLDVEKCLNQLGSLDRMMLSRIILQEYTQAEAASLLGMAVRTISYKFPQAIDRLTEKLLESGLLVLTALIL